MSPEDIARTEIARIIADTSRGRTNAARAARRAEWCRVARAAGMRCAGCGGPMSPQCGPHCYTGSARSARISS